MYFAARVSYDTILITTSAHLIFIQGLITRKLDEANFNNLTKHRLDAILRVKERQKCDLLQISAKQRFQIHSEAVEQRLSHTQT